MGLPARYRCRDDLDSYHRLCLYDICINREPESKDRTDSVTVSSLVLIGDFLRGIWGLLLVKERNASKDWLKFNKCKPEVGKVFCPITNFILKLSSRIELPSFKFWICRRTPCYESVSTSATTSYFS